MDDCLLTAQEIEQVERQSKAPAGLAADRELCGRVILGFRPLIESIARSYCRRSSLSLEDLMSEAYLKIVKHIGEYRADHGTLQAMVIFYARQAMWTAVRAASLRSRTVRFRECP